MAKSNKPAEAPANRLLGLLSPRDYGRLRPHLDALESGARFSRNRQGANERWQVKYERVGFMSDCRTEACTRS